MPIPLYQAKADFFRTLGHPARIRILELLSERDYAVHELLDADRGRAEQPLAAARGAASSGAGGATGEGGARWSTRSPPRRFVSCCWWPA